MNDNMKCHPFGGSDYCYYCGKDMCTHDGLPRECEARRPAPTPPKLIAWSCADEANGGKCCGSWCGEEDTCPAAFETPNVEVQRDSGSIIAGGSAGTTSSASFRRAARTDF